MPDLLSNTPINPGQTENYLNLLRTVALSGRIKSDRTGTGTMSIFGHQMRYDLNAGFPLETTKFTAFRLIKEELLWFLRGSTNAQELIDVNCHIWDAWMVPEDIYEEVNEKILDDEVNEKILDDEGIPRTKSVPRVKKGELGPVYGAQWRSWQNYKGGTIDQLKECIELLKTKPTSRRIIVSAWNPADLPDESKPPHVNAAEGRMALAACHTMFQFMAEPLTLVERNLYWYGQRNDLMETLQGLPDSTPEAYLRYTIDSMTEGSREKMSQQLDDQNVPKYRLSCQLYQRSADTTLGVPFNVASYALLTHMVAQCVNMVPGDFVHTFGDAHIYLNHFEEGSTFLPADLPGKRAPKGEGVDSLMLRTPLPFPKLWLNPAITDIDAFASDDIRIEGYRHQGKMSFDVAV